MKTRYRDTVAEINLKNLYYNYDHVQKIVKDKKVIPVVKANAYGHGAMEVVEYLVDKGIDYFAVSLLEEALELRSKFKDIGILVMGIVTGDALLIASENNITVTICDLDQIEFLSKLTSSYKNVHIDNEDKIQEETKNQKSEIFVKSIEFENESENDVTFINDENSRSIYKSVTENFHKIDDAKIFQNENLNFEKKLDNRNQNDEKIVNLHNSENSFISLKKSEALISIENLKDGQTSISIGNSKMQKILKVHLKIDTGMNRLGFKKNEDIKFAFHELLANPMIELEGIFTHFSTADVDKSYYDIQMRKFIEIYTMLDHKFDMVHLSNSSSQIKYEDTIPFSTHTRLGISLYGLTLDEETKFLKNTFTLKTKIGQLKFLNKNDKVGYGATYTASGQEIIGVLPIGYADGFIRKNQGGDVEINGKRYPIVGRICMDQMFIRVDETVSKDDDVILFGGIVSIDEVATRLDTINYEVICLISDRVPREYIR